MIISQQPVFDANDSTTMNGTKVSSSSSSSYQRFNDGQHKSALYNSPMFFMVMGRCQQSVSRLYYVVDNVTKTKNQSDNRPPTKTSCNQCFDDGIKEALTAAGDKRGEGREKKRVLLEYNDKYRHTNHEKELW
jgi:hypothetical protein